MSGIRIIEGDCLEVMQTMEAGTVDLIVTSPPYNLRNSTGNGMRNPGSDSKWSPDLKDGYAAAYYDDMPHAEYVRWQRDCLRAMLRLLPETGAIFYNHKWRVQGGLLQDRADIVDGFPVRQIIIWDKGSGLNFNPGYFLPRYEVIYLIAKPAFRLAPKANAAGDVWRFPSDHGNPHPAPFPVDLPLRCIAATEGGLVLDPFCGSGSTLIAAKQLGRDAIGIERAPEYVAMAEARLTGDRQMNMFSP